MMFIGSVTYSHHCCLDSLLAVQTDTYCTKHCENNQKHINKILRLKETNLFRNILQMSTK